jgi:Tfp pilus tip-associated adhesin PilY1
VVRTYTQEMQNFANWYQYDRSHILLVRSGVSQAFMKLPENFRVNFALLNQMDDGPNNVQYATTHNFDLDVRQNILQRVFQTPISTDGTPSRIAVYNIGQWLSETPDQSAPWGARDAERTALSYCSSTGDGGLYGDACILKNLSCRQNYLVFATDGDWNGSSGLSSNQDGTNGSAITGPGGQSYTYTAAAPYKDSYSGTLADNAMKFWKNDIQTGQNGAVDLPNDVPTNAFDPAFWQHMVLFGVGLGVNGTSDLPDMLAGTTAWPDPNNGPLQRIDDLAHAGLDTRGGYLSAADPSQFAQALSDTLTSIVSRVASSTSAAVSAQPAGEYKTTTQAFTASYHPNGWWGELNAFPIFRTANGGLTTGQYANWNASCVLTGGECSSMENSPTITAEAPTDRTLLTWDNNAGALFSATTTGLNSNLAGYLAGTRTNEQPSGTYRKRTGVLGDIVDSSPTWVGPPGYGYGTSMKDLLTNATGSETSYDAFKNSKAQREQVIYAGANDGFVHGFRAGSNDTNGDFAAATNDGKEVMAYFPSVLKNTISNYASPDYSHQYFVNATPGTGDLFYGGAWHTWLVGGLGAGGRAFYALDVTDPSSFSASNVRDEVNPSNIDTLCGTPCANDLGNTFGTPVIRRMHNGNWAIIAGNGYNSPSGNASIFIMEVGSNGTISSIKDIPIAGPVGGKANGIAEVTAADLDGDKITDYLYAADLYGHVYRVDVTSASDASWGANPNLLYSAKDASGTAQPITTSVMVSSVPQTSGDPKIIVMFGTGSSLTNTDLNSTQGQTVYGIWDGDMTDWNSRSSVHYAKWSSAPAALARSNLQSQEITSIGSEDGVTYRTLSNNPVCWAGDSGISGCTTYNQYGWYANLPASGERVVYNPVLINGALQLNTSIPTANVGLTCNAKPATGFTMAFNPATGGIFTKNGTPSPFFANKDNELVLFNDNPIMGVGLGATGSIGIIKDNGKVFAVLNQQNGGVTFKQQQPVGPSGNGGRITWIQLR